MNSHLPAHSLLSIPGFLRALPQISAPGCTARVLYSPTRHPYPVELTSLLDKIQPDHLPILDRIASQPENTLRWTVVSRALGKTLPKSTLRSHVGNRWKKAFTKVLSEDGYGVDGRRFADFGRTGWGWTTGLRGTLCLVLMKTGGLENSDQVLLEECRAALKAVKWGMANTTKVAAMGNSARKYGRTGR